MSNEPMEQYDGTLMNPKKKYSKLDLKRIAAYEERRKRMRNNGVPEDKIDANIAAEDYKALPADKKIERMEHIFSQALQALQNDILALRHNDGVIADAMDINLRAMSVALEKAGVTKEMQQQIIVDVQRSVAEERAKLTEATERSRMQEEANAAPKLTTEPTAEPEAAPQEATVFGS